MASSSSTENKKKSEGLRKLKKFSKAQASGETVKYVYLHNMHVDMYAMAYFVLYFKERLPRVTCLDLWNCEMKGQYLNDLFAVLKEDGTVKDLRLSNNRFNTKGPQIVDALHASVIEKLNLSMNIIDSEGLANLARGIEKSSSLWWLDIRENNTITSLDAFNTFCLAVTRSPIEYLDLSSLFSKKRSTECVLILCKTILLKFYGAKVQKLLITMNNIDDAGAKLIAGALHYEPTITSLSLYGNNITNEGARDLIHITDKHGIKLDLGRNSLSPKLQEAVDAKYLSMIQERDIQEEQQQ